MITDRIISKYNLISHYKIKETNKFKKTLVKNKFKSRVSYNKTTYQGLIISVLDTDPQMASDIANDISSLLDSLVMNMQMQRAQEAYNIALNTYEAENAYLQKLEDSLDTYRQLGCWISTRMLTDLLKLMPNHWVKIHLHQGQKLF